MNDTIQTEEDIKKYLGLHIGCSDSDRKEGIDLKDRTRKIIVAVLLVIAVCCAGYLIWYYATAAKDEAVVWMMQKAGNGKCETVKTDSDDGEQTKPEIPVDFTCSSGKNPDIYAWIKIDGTTVDYPVCQNNEDDNYYLSHTWERVEAADGAILHRHATVRILQISIRLFTDIRWVRV